MKNLGIRIWSTLDNLETSEFMNLTTLGPCLFLKQKNSKGFGPFSCISNSVRNRLYDQGYLLNTNPQINPLYEQTSKTLLNARWNFYRGNILEAQRIAHHIIHFEECWVAKAFAFMILSQIETSQGNPGIYTQNLEQAYEYCLKHYSHEPEVEQQLIRSCMMSGDITSAKNWMSKTIENNSHLPSIEQTLIMARLVRFESQVLNDDQLGKIDLLREGMSLLEPFCAQNFSQIIHGSYSQYLLSETQRRLGEYLALILQWQSKWTEANEVLGNLEKIDPNCARLQFLLGENYLRMREHNLAYTHLVRSLMLGGTDRACIYNHLAAISKTESMTQLLRWKNQTLSRKTLNSSMEIRRDKKYPSQTIKLDWELWREKLKLSPHYNQFRTYFDFIKPTEKSALHASFPYICAQNLEHKKSYGPQTLSLPWAVKNDMRDELVQALLHPCSVVGATLGELASFEFFDHFAGIRNKLALRVSDSEKEFFNLEGKSNLLLSLGFYEKALSILPNFEEIQAALPETNYLLGTRLIVESKLGLEVESILNYTEQLLRKLPRTDEFLQRRFQLSLNASLLSVQQSQEFNKFRLMLEEAWLDVACHSSCLSFEKSLMESAYRRFLINEDAVKGDLSTVCEEWQRHADKIIASSEVEHLLKREDLLLGLRSCAQAWLQLGETSHAICFLERIAMDIDPFSSHALLELGDLYESMGEVDKAQKAFARAACLGEFAAGKAWYRLGKLLQRTNESSAALLAFYEAQFYMTEDQQTYSLFSKPTNSFLCKA